MHSMLIVMVTRVWRFEIPAIVPITHMAECYIG